METNTETDYVKKNQTLPDYIHREFQLTASVEARDMMIKALRDLGWTLEAISSAANLTRERVRQVAKNAPEPDFSKLHIEIPEPPTKPQKKRPEYKEPSPEILKRLLELQPYAQLVRSSGKRYRAEAEEYTALLNHAHTVEGVTLYRLAKRLGVTHGAIRFRLVRYGYKDPITATSKVYQPIKQDNRYLAESEDA